MDHRLNELSSLYAISSNITSTLSLEHVVTNTLKEVSRAVAPDLMLFYLRHGDRIMLEQAWPSSERFKHLGLETTSVGECLCGLAGDGSAIYAKDIHSDPNCTLDDCRKAGIRSIAALPLRGYDGVIGVLTLLSLNERDFSAQCSFLETVAAQVAIALQNAIVYEQSREYAEELERSVAQRREAEKSLRKSEAYYRQLLDTMNDGVAVGNADGVLTYVNRAFCEMLGVTASELIGKKFMDLLDETNRNRWLEQQAQRKRGISSTYELEISRTDGGTLVCVASGAPIMDENGRFAGSIGLLTNITERKQAEESLRERNRILTFLAHYNELTSSHSVDGVIEATLQFVRDKLGFRESSIAILSPGRDTFFLKASTHSDELGLTPGLSMPAHATVLSEVVTEHQPRYRPDIAATNSGYEIDRQLLKAGFKSDFLVPLWVENECIGTLNIGEATIDGFTETDRQLISLIAPRLAQALHNARLYESLQQSEEQYRTLVEGSPDIVYSFSNKRGGVYYSPRVESLLGYPVSTLLEHPFLWHDSIHPDDLGKVDDILTRLSTTSPFEVEYRIKNAHGQWRWFRDRSIGFHVTEDEIIINGLAADITEHWKLEAQLLQAQKMEAVGQLAGGIAHDFNNILTAIVGYGTIMQMKMDPDDPLRATVDGILSSAERAANLTQSLLAFGRRQLIQTKTVNLNEIIRSTKAVLKRVIPEDIELATKLSAGELKVQVDSGQMEQVLLNLATNARDAMPEGGTLIIESGTADIDEEFKKIHGYGDPGTYAVLAVSDSGTGIPEGIRARIFEPFFTTKDAGKGSGLGLSMVYGIVKQHEGYITVSSEVGRGTTFRIYLPLSPSEIERELPHERKMTAASGSETILVAEDDDAIRKLMKEFLEMNGYTVHVAKDGDVARTLFMEHKDAIQLVITDVVMPKKSGRELYNDILKIRPGVKAIFISGYAGEFINKKGIHKEALPVVHKPLSPNDLLLQVRTVLDET